MMLVVDTTNNQILRYDPISGTPLGAFGRGRLGNFTNPPRLSLDPFAPETVLATDIQGYVRRFNFSTGMELGTFRLANATGNVFPRALRVMPSGDLLGVLSNLNQAHVYDRNTGAVRSSFEIYQGYTLLDAHVLGDGTFVTLERTTPSAGTFDFHLIRRNRFGGFQDWSPSFATASSGDEYTSLTARGGRIYVSGGATAPNVIRFDTAGSGFSRTDLDFNRLIGGSMSSVVLGHGSAGYFFQNISSSTARLYRLDTVSNFYGNPQPTPYSQNLGDAVMVVAPEPGTLAALGIGLAALVRRRRSRR